MHLIPHVRTWGKRLIAGALGLAALYLLAANLFLLPGVGPGLISRRPERFRIGWRSAWSVWPGEVRFTGLELRGHQPRVRWWITAEEGTARIDLPALLRREVRVEHLRAWGVRSQTDRLPRPETTEPVPPPRRGPWTVRLEQVELSGVRTLGYGPLQLEGDGRIAGSLRIVMRREVELGATVLTMPHGRLRLDGAHGADIARETNVRAELRLGPYSPRQHRGIARFDFLTGRLTADGKVLTTVETPRGASPSEVPAVLQRFLGMKGAAAGDAPRGVSTVGDVGLGALAVDLRLEQGRLVRGSRLRFAAPGGSRLAVSAEVTDRLALAAEGWNLTLQWRDGSPFLAVDAARLTADSSELRLSRLIAETRSGRVRDPLRGNVEATGLRLWAVGRTAAAEITAEQGSGQLGLAALLGRRVVLDHLRASGVAVRVERGRRSSTVPSGGQSPWQLEMTNARIERLREVAIDALRIEGAGEVAGSLAWDGSALVIRDGALEVRGGRVWRGSEELARGVDARLTGGVDPCALRQHPGLAALDCATLGLRATAEVPRLQAMAAMVGSGPLRTDLRIERGIVRAGELPGDGIGAVRRVGDRHGRRGRRAAAGRRGARSGSRRWSGPAAGAARRRGAGERAGRGSAARTPPRRARSRTREPARGRGPRSLRAPHGGAGRAHCLEPGPRPGERPDRPGRPGAPRGGALRGPRGRRAAGGPQERARRDAASSAGHPVVEGAHPQCPDHRCAGGLVRSQPPARERPDRREPGGGVRRRSPHLPARPSRPDVRLGLDRIGRQDRGARRVSAVGPPHRAVHSGRAARRAPVPSDLRQPGGGRRRLIPRLSAALLPPGAGAGRARPSLGGRPPGRRVPPPWLAHHRRSGRGHGRVPAQPGDGLGQSRGAGRSRAGAASGPGHRLQPLSARGTRPSRSVAARGGGGDAAQPHLRGSRPGHAGEEGAGAHRPARS